MAKIRSTRTGRRSALSRERILIVAMELADDQGLDGLSMRKVAHALGVEAMSLYNHVTNKEDLLDGMVDRVVGQIEVPVPGKAWRSAMTVRARSAHSVLLAHPWAALLIMSRVNVGPSMLRYVNATVGCLREAGFTWAQTDHAWNALDNHIYGFTLQELNFPFEPDVYAQAAQAYLPKIPAAQYPYMHAMAQQIINGSHQGVQDLEFGLTLLLDGLQRLLPPSKN